MKPKLFFLAVTLVLFFMGPPGHAIAWHFGRIVLLKTFGVDTFPGGED